MLTEERLNKIVDLTELHGTITASELMRALDASAATIRRDLGLLDRAGRILKIRGGAMAIGGRADARAMLNNTNNDKYREEKIIIAKYAASLIMPNDFVFLDAGTSTSFMIDFINTKNVTFVTNAIDHARRLTSKGYTTYLPGGILTLPTEAIEGEETLNALGQCNFTKGFWGVNGASPERGFSTPDMNEALIKKKTMEHTVKRYILCDSSKFSQVSFIKFAEFSDAVILTSRLRDKKLERFTNIREVDKQ